MAKSTVTASADPYANLSLTVERKRKGRSDKVRQARFATLDSLFKGAQRDLTVTTNGKAETVKATVVGPAHFDQPETFTGIPATVAQWAKDRGHAVRCLKVSGNVYGIVRKG